jgi:hypothetical protein
MASYIPTKLAQSSKRRRWLWAFRRKLFIRNSQSLNRNCLDARRNILRESVRRRCWLSKKDCEARKKAC